MMLSIKHHHFLSDLFFSPVGPVKNLNEKPPAINGGFSREKESMKDAGRWNVGFLRACTNKSTNLKITTSKNPAL
jgi:hypothetical protein